MDAQVAKTNNGGNGRRAGRNGNGMGEALRESEGRCRQLQDQLIQAEKLAGLGTLVSGMAHEINNPVQCIFGMAEIILDEQDPAKIREYAQDIIRLSKHIATVVRDVSCYARPGSREDEIDVDLCERLTEVIKMVRRCPQFGQVEVVTQFQPVPPLRARRVEIDQIFVNLLSNAAQAMEGRGRLELATQSQGGTMIVRVSDTGCGIPKALLHRIFDPFFTTKDPGKGTGLGLSIVYQIVSKYGGTIGIESEEGKGATFTVQFPAENRKKEARDGVAGPCCGKREAGACVGGR
ncbi:MAG: ATP-binding protein [Nitrospirota bacterium]